ncbi:MAG: hypothetical protein A2061_09450 [Gallionellales bacterium GWA2_59_43]|nr:MAG: hypothetical protein A2061_09450 [Gallionellales bacterium GWA2_59_43]
MTSLDKGKPVPDAEVAVRDCKGKSYFQGRTDAQGILKIDRALPQLGSLPGCFNEYDRQYFVTARAGKDFSFVLSDWNEGIALWRFKPFRTDGWDRTSSMRSWIARCCAPVKRYT